MLETYSTNAISSRDLDAFVDPWRMRVHRLLEDQMPAITINAVDFMNQGMEEIFNNGLKPVSEYDPSYFSLQKDPLDVLLAQDTIAKGDRFKETWSTTQEVMMYLKKCVVRDKTKDKSLLSERSWHEINDYTIPRQSMSPIVGRKAKQETPLQVSGTRRPFPAPSLTGSLAYIQPSATGEAELLLNPDDVLTTKITLDREMANQVLSLVRSTPFSKAVPKDSRAESNAFETLSQPDHSSYIPIGRVMSPPIFSRQSQIGRTVIPNTLLNDKSLIAPAPVADEVLDLPGIHMALVEGWPTIPVDFSSTPLPGGEDTEDEDIQLDELRVPSTPVTSKSLKLMCQSLMDEVLLPRSEAFRGSRKRKRSISPSTSFVKNVKSLVTPQPSTSRSSRSGGKQPLSTQAASNTAESKTSHVFDDSLTIIQSESGAEEDIDRVVYGLGNKSLHEDPYGYIYSERFEVKDSMFLSVPILNNPTKFESAYLKDPRDLRMYCIEVDIPHSIAHKLPNVSTISLLEPAKQLASLNIELSWLPFIYDGPKLTHEAISNVHQLPTIFLTKPLHEVPFLSAENLKQARSLVESIIGKKDEGRLQRSREVWCSDYGFSRNHQGQQSSNDGILLLSRRELRLAKATAYSDSPTIASNPDELMNVVTSEGTALSPNYAATFDAHEAFVSCFTQDKQENYSTEKHHLSSSNNINLQSQEPSRQKHPNRGISSAGDQSNVAPVKQHTSLRGDSLLIADLITDMPTPILSFLSSEQLLRQFLQHRTVKVTEKEVNKDIAVDDAPIVAENRPETNDLRAELTNLNRHLHISSAWTIPATQHYYLASIPFLQRRALILLLQNDCSVKLHEVEELHGPDVIMDSHSAVVFITISIVPSMMLELKTKICQLSFSFSRILVILEAFPSNQATFSLDRLQHSRSSDLQLITPNVVSSCLKLKRQVGLSLAMEHDGISDDIFVEFVVAWNVVECARYTRCFGDYAELSVSGEEHQLFWGDRDWLDANEEDYDLGSWVGMNSFASRAIGSVIPLEEFVSLSLEEKLHWFGSLLGSFRMTLFDSAYRDQTALLNAQD